MAQRGRAAARIGAALIAAGFIIPLLGNGAACANEAKAAAEGAPKVATKTAALSPRHERAHERATVSAKAPRTAKQASRKSQVGLASFYGAKHRGKKTASGARFDDRALTAAHRSLPLNSKAKVTNLKTGQSVDVTINDRGPYHKNRVIDLSKAAAKQIGIDNKDGIDPVKVEPIGDGEPDLASLERR